MRSSIRALALLAIVAAACATARSDEVREYQGIFSHGFEADVFKPCGSAEQWWAVLPSDAIAKYDEMVEPYQPVMVRVRGTISDRGPSGHLGRYDRYMTVDSVLMMQPAGAARC
jgi:hypothetical protein